MKLYNELAEWWPLMQPPSVFAGEAKKIARMLRPDSPEGRASMVMLGSGGGHLASHLKKWFDMTLVDISPSMLGVSRTLNPECRHLEGDMRTVRLGEEFDALLIYDAIAHILSLEDLQATLLTARAHLKRGGRALFCPFWTAEDFPPPTRRGGSDGPDRGMRWMEWPQPEIEGTVCRTHLVYLLRHSNGELTVEHDAPDLGIFSEPAWRGALQEAGFGNIAVRRRYHLDLIAAVAE